MADLIKEFLIGIGIAINDADIKKYQKALDGTEKDIKKLDEAERKAEKEEAARLKRRGEAQAQFSRSVVAQGVLIANALEAAAKAVSQAVSGIASGFEQIYYASQRTGASIDNLRGVAHAVGQLGGSYQGALQSVENFAKQMRTNPGYGAMVRSLGVATEVNGKLRDTTDILADLGESFAGKEYHVGFQYAQALGIDEQTYRLLRDQPEALRRYKEEYARTAKTVGLNSEEAGRNSVAFMQSLRSLGTFITTAAEKLLSDLAPALKGVIDQFLAYVAANPDLVQRTIHAIGEAAKAVGDLLKEMAINGRTYFTTFVEKVDEWNKEGGLIDTMGKVARAIERIIDAIGKAIQWLRDFDRATEMKGLKDIGRWLGWVDKSTGGVVQEGLGQIGAVDQATSGIITGAPPAEGGVVDGIKRRWRNRPTWLGGEGSAAGINSETGLARRGRRAAEADKTNYNFTGDNANALRQAAAELGTSPKDLATVISYETGGKFSPSIWGGKGGNYMGLIQFGGPERAQFGANDKQTFKEQLPAVVRYLKTRGFKPGMGLLDLYSTINAGSPGRYNASDGNGTVRSHVANMERQHAARVERFLNSGSGTPQPPVDYGKVAESMKGYDFSQSKPGTVPLGASSNDNSVTNSLTVAPKTEIHVTGNADPSATASAVAGAQNNVNQMSLRNARSAMR